MPKTQKPSRFEINLVREHLPEIDKKYFELKPTTPDTDTALSGAVTYIRSQVESLRRNFDQQRLLVVVRPLLSKKNSKDRKAAKRELKRILAKDHIQTSLQF